MSTTEDVILTAHLFPQLDGALITLLKSLRRDEWTLPTIVPRWNVQQIAAHLLDTALRRLSICRDDWLTVTDALTSERDLVELIDRSNAQGVETLGRCSPDVLIALTETITPQLARYLGGLHPMAPAAFAVSWAGERESLNWFDTARELTERWHHQQQIRMATNRPGIMTPVLYKPVLATFMRALPHTYRAVPARDGTTVEIVVPGECGGRWWVSHSDGAWTLVTPAEPVPVDTTVVVPDDLAWRLFTKGARDAEARARVRIYGDEELGAVIFSALAIVG